MVTQMVDLDELEPGFSADPYPVLHRLRESRPVSPVTYRGVSAWLLTKHEDVARALADPLLSVEKRYAFDKVKDVPWVMGPDAVGVGDQMLFRDPPDHDRLRRFVTRTFSKRRIKQLEGLIGHRVDELVDAIAPVGHADLVADLCIQLPTYAIMTLLGVPPSDHAEFAAQAMQANSARPDDFVRAFQAIEWLKKYVTELIAEKARRPANDLLSELVYASEGVDQLSASELLSMAVLLLVAGGENTANQISLMMCTLLRHPDQFAELKADPSLIPNALQEGLRYDGSVITVFPRYTKEPVTYSGVAIPAGDAVLLSLASARRDPAVFPDPDVFDIRRKLTASHLTFGVGARTCVGMALALIEVELAMTSLMRRLPDLKLAVDPAELTWLSPNAGRGPAALPVVFSPSR